MEGKFHPWMATISFWTTNRYSANLYMNFREDFHKKSGMAASGRAIEIEVKPMLDTLQSVPIRNFPPMENAYQRRLKGAGLARLPLWELLHTRYPVITC